MNEGRRRNRRRARTQLLAHGDGGHLGDGAAALERAGHLEVPLAHLLEGILVRSIWARHRHSGRCTSSDRRRGQCAREGPHGRRLRQRLGWRPRTLAAEQLQLHRAARSIHRVQLADGAHLLALEGGRADVVRENADGGHFGAAVANARASGVSGRARGARSGGKRSAHCLIPRGNGAERKCV